MLFWRVGRKPLTAVGGSLFKGLGEALFFSCITESRYSLCEAHFSGTEVGVGPKDLVLDGLTLQEEKSRKALVF